mmetsp:Transcript_3356/g.8545  ORF Transcript_3356/g.8545 Transcript_3356/m.8545 type:complete len:653 (+) Transcript_3356:117-2075(+)
MPAHGRRIASSIFQRSINRHYCWHHRKRSRHHSCYHTTSILGLSSNKDGNDDVDNNNGTILGIWVFHRHGDRAPNRYLGRPEHLPGESEHWHTRIPPTNSNSSPPSSAGYGGEDSRSLHDELSRYFPPDVHHSQNGGRHLDVGREPFGFLTYRGADQMRDVGRRFRRRYDRAVVGRDDDDGGGVGRRRRQRQRRDRSFLDHWNVRAYSTNYLRTVMSVQCFLDGLIGTCPNVDDDDGDGAASNDGHDRRAQIYAGGGLERYYKDQGEYERLAHMDMSTWTTADDMSRNDSSDDTGRDDGHRIKVQVREKRIDTLNAFDKYPRMMDGFVKDVIATERFQRIDGAAKAMADELSTYLPGLRGAPQAFGGTPSGINWIHANDHFVCRRAHSIPLAADFSDEYEDGQKIMQNGTKEEEDIEATLASLAIPVCSHLAWRFREWYRSPRLLSAVACPPFLEILGDMKQAAAAVDFGCDDDRRRPFVLYSCHDVTLLALLYAIGADFLVSGEDCGGVNMRSEGCGQSGDDAGSGPIAPQTSWRWWPAYSSTIAFELVRLKEEGEQQQTQHVVRVILNGDAVRLIPRMSIKDEGILEEQHVSSRQVFGEKTADGKGRMMSLSDFEHVIRVLKEVGGRCQGSSATKDKGAEPVGNIGVDGG